MTHKQYAGSRVLVKNVVYWEFFLTRVVKRLYSCSGKISSFSLDHILSLHPCLLPVKRGSIGDYYERE